MIGALPQVLKALFTSLSLGTGWHFSVYGGGPNPAHPQGDLCTMSYHHGENQQKQNFRTAYPTLYKAMKTDFTKFLRSSFGKISHSTRDAGINAPFRSSGALSFCVKRHR